MNKLTAYLVLSMLLFPVAAFAVTFSNGVRVRGNMTITGSLSKGSGTFMIDHPLDPRNKILFHSFVESDEEKNMYDGIARLDANGEALVELPEYFMALNGEFRYQFFPLDAAMPNLHIKNEIQENKFTIAGGKPYGEVSWQVTGVRHDAYILAHPPQVEVEKSSTTEVPPGTCLFEPLCE